MDLNEVRERKRALEESLAELLAGFEADTGTAVQKVAVARHDVGSFEEPDRTILSGVRLIITV